MNPTKPAVKPAWQRALITLSAVVTTSVALAALYWMRSLFIPLMLAVFFTYVLAPLVVLAQRRGLGRVPSVILVVAAAVLVFLGTTAVVTVQLAGLSETLADNKDRIKEKVAAVRKLVVGDGESKWAKMARELEQTLVPKPPADAPPTVVVEPSASWLSRADTIAGPVTEGLTQAAFAFVLVVFMLLAKEDLQDRLMRLIGDGSMTSATRATAEASRRISKYLFSQMLLNAGFGLVVAVGLFLMGVQYSLLWGFLAFLMRYVPYVGTLVGVFLPILFVFAVSDGWWQLVAVVVLYAVLEIVCNNFIEPRLYGASLGVSEVALLVAAAFWAFLWGPIGLILSGPITTCLVVLGKHLPSLRFLQVLLGTEPPLTPALALFQRLMARNQDEAVRVVEAAIPDGDPDPVFDATVIPALSLVKQAKADGQFEPDDERQVYDIAREVIDEVGLEVRAREEPIGDGPAVGRIRVLACPASDEADRLSLEALAAILPENRWEVKVTAVATLTSELAAAAETFAPHVLCIGALPPNGIAHVRYLCKRLRARLPDIHILVGRWGDADAAALTEQFTAAGASAVEGSLVGARNLLNGWLPVFSGGEAKLATVARAALNRNPLAVGTASA